jgi:UDPglucose 6-dehydrogenase
MSTVPKLCFLGGSHAGQTLCEAARRKGFQVLDQPEGANLVFVSLDTPTDERGNRYLGPVEKLFSYALSLMKPVVLTSQVPPGFTRAHCQGGSLVYHQAETLRMDDALPRAMYPDMLIVGCAHHDSVIWPTYREYLEAFDAPILKMSYEDAEMTKMAINYSLAMQVETANFLSGIAKKAGADWGRISRALRHDSRIGKYAYTSPGEWKNSLHLLRDYITLQELHARS